MTLPPLDVSSRPGQGEGKHTDRPGLHSYHFKHSYLNGLLADLSVLQNIMDTDISGRLSFATRVSIMGNFNHWPKKLALHK